MEGEDERDREKERKKGDRDAHKERQKDDRKTDGGREENRKQHRERTWARQMALLCSESHHHLPGGRGASSTSRVTPPHPYSRNALGYRLCTEVDLGSKPVSDNGHTCEHGQSQSLSESRFLS